MALHLRGGERRAAHERSPRRVSDGSAGGKAYKLKAYPYYDAPGPAEWEERLLKERGIIPDMPVSEEDAAAQPSDASGADGSTHVDPK
jgi:hypothetical protein